jgi:tetratricopeptide (TPR) repeat protein
VVLVRGEAGVGKTRLVSELAHSVRVEGGVVASTQCFGIAGRLALAPVADWLRSPVVKSATGGLDEVWRLEVGRLVPAGSDDGRPGVGARAMIDAWQRHRFFEGMARAFIEVGRPMLLVLDNLQWCDAETLAFLTFLLGLRTDTPVMVIATLRDGALGRDRELTDWTARMQATGILTEIALGPLDEADTALLAGAISGGELQEETVRLLQATTGGFPLYVVEAARTSVDVGAYSQPARDLTEVLRGRLEQVDTTAQEIAALAAAVGRDFTLDLLTEASDFDADAVVRAVDELWRRRILREFRDGYDFSHDLLRDTAYAQISPPQRWLFHRRLAQGLELLHANNTDVVSALLAEQYARGGRPDRALAYYARAAAIASGRFAHAEAIRLHEAALAIVRTLPEGRDRDRQELEILEAISGPLNASFGYSNQKLHSTLLRSIELADALDRKGSVINGLIGLWSSQYVQGNLAAGYRTVVRLESLVTPDSEMSVPAYFALGGAAMGRASHAEAVEYFDLAATLPERTPSLSVGTKPDVHGQAWAAHAHWLLGDDDVALATCRRALDLARDGEHPYSLAVALAYASITYQLTADIPALRATLIELGELCERYGFGYYREWRLVLDGWSRDDGSGIKLIRAGIKNLRAEGSLTRMPYWLSLHADGLARANDALGAKATLDAALVDGQARQDLWWLPEVMRMRAIYDEPCDAATRLAAAAQLAKDHGSLQLVRRCERDLARIGVRLAVPSTRESSSDTPLTRTL